MQTPFSFTRGRWWILFCSSMASAADDAAALRPHLTFYASFDEAVRGDFGGGALLPSTRRDNPELKGAYLYREGVDEKVFRIARGKGVHGGALEAVDVLPDRGRIFFPAKGNLPYRPGGWGGAVSFWLNTTLLRSLSGGRTAKERRRPQRPAEDSVLRSGADHREGREQRRPVGRLPGPDPTRLAAGRFPGVGRRREARARVGPAGPLVVVKKIGFKSGEWHHLVMSRENLDTGKPDAKAVLFIDGEMVGRLEGRKLSMQWDLDRAGLYFAVNYVGLLDELAVFNRPLTPAEVRRLREEPGALGKLKRPVDSKERKSP